MSRRVPGGGPALRLIAGLAAAGLALAACSSAVHVHPQAARSPASPPVSASPSPSAVPTISLTPQPALPPASAEPVRSASAIAAAAARTLATGSATLSLTETLAVPGKKSYTTFFAGAADFAADTAYLTGSFGAFSDVQAVRIGTTDYLHLPPAAHLPHGDHWVAVDLAAGLGSSSGGNAADLGAVADPIGALELLESATGSVQRRGEATILKVPTWRYALEAPLAAPPGAPAAIRALVAASVQSLGVAQVPETVWVNRLGQVVELSETLPAPAPLLPAGAANGTITFGIIYSALGSSVHISAPPAAQVATESSANAGSASTGS